VAVPGLQRTTLGVRAARGPEAAALRPGHMPPLLLRLDAERLRNLGDLGALIVDRGSEFGGALSDLMHVPFADHMLVRLPKALDPVAVASAADNVPDGWRAVRYLAHIGFLNQMPNYTRMLHFPFDSEERAKHVEAAIEKLEYAIGHPCSVRFTLPTSFVVSCHVNVRSVSAHPNRTM